MALTRDAQTLKMAFKGLDPSVPASFLRPLAPTLTECGGHTLSASAVGKWALVWELCTFHFLCLEFWTFAFIRFAEISLEQRSFSDCYIK